MPDRREEILNKIWQSDSSLLQVAIVLNSDVSLIKYAMDEYMKECCLSLLEYVAKNTITHYVAPDGIVEFKYKGEWITREQLFENFL